MVWSQDSREIGYSEDKKANPCAFKYVREIRESVLGSAIMIT